MGYKKRKSKLKFKYHKYNNKNKFKSSIKLFPINNKRKFKKKLNYIKRKLM